MTMCKRIVNELKRRAYQGQLTITFSYLVIMPFFVLFSWIFILLEMNPPKEWTSVKPIIFSDWSMTVMGNGLNYIAYLGIILAGWLLINLIHEGWYHFSNWRDKKEYLRDYLTEMNCK